MSALLIWKVFKYAFGENILDIIIKVKLANIAILSDSNNSPSGKLILHYFLVTFHCTYT